MRKKKNRVCFLAGAIVLSVSMLATGCGNTRTTAATAAAETAAETAASSGKTSAAGTEASSQTVTVRSDGTDLSTVYDKADLNDTWDSAATEIKMSGNAAEIKGSGAAYQNGKVKITKAGTYVLSGELTDGQIEIDAEKEAVVHIVLNGVKVTSSASAAFYATKNAKKVIVTLAPGTVNELADAKEYTYENTDDEEPDAALFVKNDLTFNGSGTLKITANSRAIHTKDSLVILGGSYEISSADDCFNGKDSISVEGGLFDLTVTDTKTGKGMTSRGDVKLYGGAMNIEDCNEGLEGLTVQIYAGNFYIKAEDDGINAREKTDDTAVTEQSKMKDNTKCLIMIAGGLVQIDARGDSLDSNGELEIKGGEIYLSGPTSKGDGTLDFNGTGTISGGTLIGAGSTGMVQTFGNDSTQNNITIYYDNTIAADTEIKIMDSDGNEIASWTPPKQYQCVQISSPDLKTGETYTVTAGTDTQTVTISGVNNTVGTQQGGRGGQGQGGPGGGQGGGPGGGQGGGQGGPGGKDGKSGNNSADKNGSSSGTDAGSENMQGQPPQGGPGMDNRDGGPGNGNPPGQDMPAGNPASDTESSSAAQTESGTGE